MPAPRINVPVSIVGLPSSGKTTFLAALWHLVQADEVETRLKFGSLGDAEFAYLNSRTKRWRSATEQERTEIAGIKSVRMNLLSADHREVRVTFPDVPGEEYRRMWEDREVAEDLARTLSAGNIMLLVNGNRIKRPAWITERTALKKAVGDLSENAEPTEWHPKHAPTQVQLVDLLQHLRRPPLDAGGRRLVVMISAWDKAEQETLSPDAFLKSKLPLVYQYLNAGRDAWTWRVYGVSAQGGEYDEAKPRAKPRRDAARLRDFDMPSKRIRLVLGNYESHDLTEPLEWLMS